MSLKKHTGLKQIGGEAMNWIRPRHDRPAEAAMIDKRALQNELTEAFIQYQYTLEHPFSLPGEPMEALRLKYMNDPIFHNKVDSMVCRVMFIVIRHTGSNGT